MSSSPAVDRLHNADAERAVLGCILIQPDNLIELANTLTPTDFVDHRHQLIFEAMLDLDACDASIDPVSVNNHLLLHGTLNKAGGGAYLHELLEQAPASASARYYSTMVIAAAKYRHLTKLGSRMSQSAALGSDGVEWAEIAETFRHELEELGAESDASPLRPVAEYSGPALAAMAQDSSDLLVPTGFHDMDRLLGGGLQPGQFVVCAGRPSTGKSTLMLDIARHVALKLRQPTAVFSLEMSADELLHRIYAAEAGVPLQSVRTGDMSDDEWLRVMAVADNMSDAPLWIDPTPAVTISDVRNRIRQLNKTIDGQVKVAVFDYLQLASPSRSHDTREQQVSEMSRQSKLTAKQMDCVMLVGCQLNRGPEARPDKKPLLSDLRESGCLTGDTRLLRADTGTYIRMIDLQHSTEPVWVWSLNHDQNLVAQPITKVWSTGRKPVFTMHTSSGRTITATANHKFLTSTGWKALEQISAGTRIAIPTRLPEPRNTVTPLQTLHLQADALPALLQAPTQTVLDTLRTWATSPNSSAPVLVTTGDTFAADDAVAVANRAGLQASRHTTEDGLITVSLTHPSQLSALTSQIPHPSRTITFDVVDRIEAAGHAETFDATVHQTHNFVADGIIAHNSIEQDADIVMLMHRDVATDEDERAGEADIILAKHRNGPTGVVPVATLLDLAHFQSLARS